MATTSPNASPDRVMSPLNFVVKLKPGAKAGIEQVNPMMEAQLQKGADAIGTLHEARFIRYDDETILVFTTYDGSFDDYIFDFTKYMSDIFNFMLANAADSPPLPIEKNPQEFADWVRARDLTSIAYYNAFPKAECAGHQGPGIQASRELAVALLSARTFLSAESADYRRGVSALRTTPGNEHPLNRLTERSFARANARLSVIQGLFSAGAVPGFPPRAS